MIQDLSGVYFYVYDVAIFSIYFYFFSGKSIRWNLTF